MYVLSIICIIFTCIHDIVPCVYTYMCMYIYIYIYILHYVVSMREAMADGHASHETIQACPTSMVTILIHHYV